MWVFLPFCRIFLPLLGFNCRRVKNGGSWSRFTVCMINHFLLRNSGVFNQKKCIIVFENSYSLFLSRRTPSQPLPFSRYIRLKFEIVLAVIKTAHLPNTRREPSCSHRICISLTRFIFCRCNLTLMLLVLRLVLNSWLYFYRLMLFNEAIKPWIIFIQGQQPPCNLHCIIYLRIV